MVRILSKQRAKPFRVHKGRAPRHLRKIENPVSKMYGSLGLASSSNRQISEDMGEEPVGNPEPSVPVAKPDFKAEGQKIRGDGGASATRPTVQLLREGKFDLPLSRELLREGVQQTLFGEVVVTQIDDDDRAQVERFMAKYGEDAEDYAEMSRDLELNRFQFSSSQIRRLFIRYRRAQQGPVVKPANRIFLERAGGGEGAQGGTGDEINEEMAKGMEETAARAADGAFPGSAADAAAPAAPEGSERPQPSDSPQVQRRRGRHAESHADPRRRHHAGSSLKGAPSRRLPAPQPVESMSIEEAEALARIFAKR